MSNPRPHPDVRRAPSRRERGPLPGACSGVPFQGAPSGVRGAAKTRRSATQRGQALVLIALAFVGLASFIGLAVDSGILFTQIGHLRRAVDSAALAAANQFREGRTVGELTSAATQFINLNGVNTGTAEVFICEEPFGPGPYSPAHDPTLCPALGSGDPYRKFVRVEAEVLVNFAFLPIIGIYSFPIQASAVSEAASIDVVLVVDTSSSMSFDLCRDGIDNDEDGVIDDCNGFPQPQNGPVPDSDPATCNLNRFLADDVVGDDPGLPPDGDREDDCHPFEEVRDATEALLSRMYFPYDRMAVVTFANVGSRQLHLADGDNVLDVFNTLEALEVSPDPGNPPCDFSGGDPRGCTNTNTSEGLLIGGNYFGDPNADGTAVPGEIREEAVWILIVLGDGGANALRDPAYPVADRQGWICPNSLGPDQPTWVQPFCRDPLASTRHSFGNAEYDADDAARDAADFVGCPDAFSPQPAGCPAPGQGAVIFSIGLGDLVIDNPCWPGYGGSCDPDLGERLLRYAAGVGDDGNPASPGDPCNGAASGTDCGNYYFAPTGSGLIRVFEAIASRIFTRLTQ